MTEPSVRTAARVAGLALPLSFFVLACSTFALHGPLLASDDPAETARAILDNQATYRLGIVGHLLYAIGNVAFAGALYVVLRGTDRTLAALASAFRLAWAFSWIPVAIDFVRALTILEDPATNAAFGDRTAALAAVHLNGYDVYYVGLVFWAISATIMSWALYRGRLVPRWLALFGLVAAAWCAVCAFGHYLKPGFVNLWAYDTALALFELLLGGWLLFRGTATPQE
jgi:hypothetical protein